MTVGNGASSAIIILTSVFLPPLGVFLLKGCGPEVIIDICLTILGWFPGMIYAVYLWMVDGGLQKSSVAEARIEKVKQKYRDLRAKANSENLPETVSERDSGIPREPLTDETTTAQSAGETQHQAVRESRSSIPSRPVGILQAYPRPTSAQAIRDDMPQSVIKANEDDPAPEVLSTPQAPSVGTSDSVVPQTAAQSALTGVASQESSTKSPAKTHKNLPGFYRGLFATKKSKAHDHISSEDVTSEGVSNQITPEQQVPSPRSENVVEVAVANSTATNANPVITPMKANDATDDVTAKASK